MNQSSSNTPSSHAGYAIRAIRTAQLLSLRDLAGLSGTSYAYISQVERGLATPSKTWLRAVTDALGQNLAANTRASL